MGFFKDLKEIFVLMKEIRDIKEMTPEEEERLRALSTDELMALSDKDLFIAVDTRIEGKMMVEYPELLKVLEELNESEKVYYCVQNFDHDVLINSLYFYLSTMDGECAPYISGYLEILGAYEHKRLFDDFVRENNINLYDLSEFKVSGERKIEKLKKRYGIDKFGEKYAELKSMDYYLLEYVRQNIKEF